jgi:hypothetical protein
LNRELAPCMVRIQRQQRVIKIKQRQIQHI